MPGTRISIGSVPLRPVRLFVASLVFRCASTMEHVVAEGCSNLSLENGIPPRDVHRSALASSLSRLVYEVGDEIILNDEDTALLESHGFSDARHYVDDVDTVLAARHEDDYCLLAFRGTVFSEMEDLLSNLDAAVVDFNSTQDSYDYNFTNPTDSCDLHQGYYDIYTNFKYKAEVEEYLETCTFECPTCEVVLTGHSQGGGVSEIYALYLKERFSGSDDNSTESSPPYVITFGGVEALGYGCMPFISEEERCRWYHYIMAIGTPLGRTIAFDPIPTGFLNIYRITGDDKIGETYVRNGVAAPGHMIMVSSEDPTSSYYAGFDGNYTINFKKLPVDLTIRAHSKILYMDVLNKLSDNYAGGSTPLPTNGFSLDSVCNTDVDLCGERLECKRVDLLQNQKCVSVEKEDRDRDMNSGSGIQGGFFPTSLRKLSGSHSLVLIIPILVSVFAGGL